MKLSTLAQSIKPSPTLALSAKATAMRAQGLDVISLTAGELDLEPPAVVGSAAREIIGKGKILYTAASGIPALRKAVAEKYGKRHSIELAEKNVVITSGAKQAVANALLALINPGDEVIIPAPYWVSYPDMATLAYGKRVIIETIPENNFKITIPQLKQAITSKAKALIINSPSNPTGAIYTKEEFEKILDVLKGTDVTIVSDEIYDMLVLDGKFTSFLDFGKSIFDRAVIINGVSKAYAMTGWRIGWAIGNEEIIGAMGRMQGHQTSNACTVSQHAALAALKEGDDFAANLAPLMRKRRDSAMKLLNTVPGFRPIKPDGAFYIFCDVRGVLGRQFATSSAFAEFLLQKALVATVPGEDFGAPGFLRLSIATSEELFAKAVQRIIDVLKQ